MSDSAAPAGALVLVLDTATPAVTAAVVRVHPDSVRVLAREITVDARAHGERLAPAVRTVLHRSAAEPADLAAVVAGTGPGPFTGLRVGLVTATAFGQALDIPTYGVCSLDGIGATSTGRTLVATDARRREIYWAVYTGGRRSSEPRVDSPADVAAELAAGPDPVSRAVGAGALLYAEVLGLPVDEQPSYPDPAALAGLAADRVRSGAPGERLTPRYLRRPDVTLSAATRPAPS